MKLEAAALLCVLQLPSPALLIGAYSYSHGLEEALEQELVHDEASARTWIVDALYHVVARFEVPVVWHLLQTFERRDEAAVAHWTE